MLHKKIEAALNKQINQEIAGAYDYLAMAAYFERISLSGFSSWMLHQRAEELEHAMKLFHYIVDRRGRVELQAVSKPQTDYDSVKAVFERALELEKQNTEAINELYSLAVQLNDYATQSHLQWFLDEQVEEEKSMDEVISLLEMAGDDKAALFALNRQLAERTAASG